RSFPHTRTPHHTATRTPHHTATHGPHTTQPHTDPTPHSHTRTLHHTATHGPHTTHRPHTTHSHHTTHTLMYTTYIHISRAQYVSPTTLTQNRTQHLNPQHTKCGPKPELTHTHTHTHTHPLLPTIHDFPIVEPKCASRILWQVGKKKTLSPFICVLISQFNCLRAQI